MLRLQNLCPGSNNVFDLRQKHVLFPSSKICFCNICFAHTAKLRNICLGNNVSYFSQPLDLPRPSLACSVHKISLNTEISSINISNSYLDFHQFVGLIRKGNRKHLIPLRDTLVSLKCDTDSYEVFTQALCFKFTILFPVP